MQASATRSATSHLKHPHQKSGSLDLPSLSRCSCLFCVAVGYLLYRGVASGASTFPVAWGFAITNFVWWIGIGHAGTFISAILLLLFQKWRTTINRFTEAMTLFAVICAGMFPLLHLGRPWVFLLAAALPGHDGAVAAISQPAGVGRFRRQHLFHGVADLLVVGVVPDLATVRDKAETKWKRIIYGIGRAGLARFGKALAAPSIGLSACSAVWRRHWCSRFIAW